LRRGVRGGRCAPCYKLWLQEKTGSSAHAPAATTTSDSTHPVTRLSLATLAAAAAAAASAVAAPAAAAAVAGPDATVDTEVALPHYQKKMMPFHSLRFAVASTQKFMTAFDECRPVMWLGKTAISMVIIRRGQLITDESKEYRNDSLELAQLGKVA